MTQTTTNPSGPQSSPMIDVSKWGPEEGLDRLIAYAMALNSSDLFLVSNEQHIGVQVRSLGVIRPIAMLGTEQGRRMMSTLKVRAGMDLNEKRRPLDGRWIYSTEGASVDLRINTIPTMYGEDFAIRLLDRNTRLLGMEHLGLTREQYEQLTQMIDSPSGLMLICGPTGSGKTATLYACLQRLNDGKKKINTIEDPIEFSIAGLRQSQVNPAVDLGFSELLRSVLRQSPDVIMIGEIRDAVTAQTAVHAANSGQLVLATIHAPSAASAVQSMRSLGAHTHFLATALRGIISQRLVRTLCEKCKTSFDLTDAPYTFDEVREWLAGDEGKRLYAPRGCDACTQVGYAARTGVFEILAVTREIRNLIAEGQPTREIRDKAKEQKMLEFRQAALLKVAQGLTSTEEVFRVIPAEHLMQED